MSFGLLLQICGMPLFVIGVALSVILSIGALLLTFKARRELLLSAFFPLCSLPLLVSVAYSFMGLLSSIGVQLSDEEQALREPAFLLTMNLIPIFFGATASALPATLTILGRWTLAWRASGIRILPESKPDAGDEGGFDQEAWTSRETDEYIDQLVRPR